MGKIEKRKDERRETRRERENQARRREKGEGKVYSSDRQNTIRVALRTAIVGSAMTGLLLIPGEK